MVGNGMGAKNGIMFKTAVSLENAGKTEIVALDKTGTITSGEPRVTDVLPAAGVSRRGADRGSVCTGAEERTSAGKSNSWLMARNAAENRRKWQSLQAVPGNGLTGVCNGKFLAGGNRAFIERKTAGGSERGGGALPSVRGACKSGKDTAVFLCRDGKLLGVIAVADVIKEDSPRAVRELQNMGIRVVMLTGDNERTAKAIGAQAGVDEVIAGVLPDGKEAVIRRLKEQGPYGNGRRWN